MKKSLFSFIVTICAITAVGFAQAAQIYTEIADGSPAMRVYCADEAVSVTITAAGASATNDVTIGGDTSTAIDGSGDTDTVTEFAAAIAACTNSAGETPLTVDTDCALGTDSTDAELLSGTYTAAAGEWLEIPWDTSVALHYDVYIPDNNVEDGVYRGVITINDIFGNPTGTGSVTLSVYLDGVLSWQKLMPEVYAYSNNTASVDLPVLANIPAAKKAVLIRATRATTATTGLIGATITAD